MLANTKPNSTQKKDSYGGINKVRTQVRGKCKSDQKCTSIVLEKWLFCLKTYIGGGGVKHSAYLSVPTLWMAPTGKASNIWG